MKQFRVEMSNSIPETLVDFLAKYNSFVTHVEDRLGEKKDGLAEWQARDAQRVIDEIDEVFSTTTITLPNNLFIPSDADPVQTGVWAYKLALEHASKALGITFKFEE